MSPAATPHSGTDAPKKPDGYWLFHTETTRALMVEVRLNDGTLMVRWRAKDVPVTELNAVWHGPIPTSFGPE
jgi:hypothetical protein